MLTRHEEWLDLVDGRDQVIGQVTRDDAWARGGCRWVRVINAFVVNARGELWIPQRTASKRMFPDCLDMSVGGHVERGETYLDAFKRETREELNLEVNGLDWSEMAAFSPHDTGLSAFMRVYEIRTETAPDTDSGRGVGKPELSRFVNETDGIRISPSRVRSDFHRFCKRFNRSQYDFNPADFSAAAWTTPGELLSRLQAAEPAKSDLAELVRRCYG